MKQKFWMRCWRGEEKLGRSVELFVPLFLLQFVLGFAASVMTAFLPGIVVAMVLMPLSMIPILVMVCWWRCAKNAASKPITILARILLSGIILIDVLALLSNLIPV
ncbi:MAG TPA: hypothetical protein V6C52_12640 [Coleofasciculaceae cyanobacterium]|jgi:hypothetical protein